jgi:hypothetical protein
MTYKGTVKGGVVVLEPGAAVADGAAVEVRVLGEPASPAAGSRVGGDDDEWRERFEAMLAEGRRWATDLPPGHVVDDSRESIYEGRGE